MSAITTYAKPQDDFLVIRVPDGYGSCSFKVVLFPMGNTLMSHGIDELSFSAAATSLHGNERISRQANEDLQQIAGTWVSDPEAETVFDEMRTVDSELWR